MPPDPARELVACARYSARRFVCLGVSGALLVIQAVMLALGFDGIMRHMLRLAAWLLPDEWGDRGTAAGLFAVIVRVFGLVLAVLSLLARVVCWVVRVPVHSRPWRQALVGDNPRGLLAGVGQAWAWASTWR